MDQARRKHILVYDLGGGTFDVSVVGVEKDVVEVLASHGNNRLGGDDFDARILDHLTDWLKRERDADPSGNRQAMARLTRAAENAKIHLSDAPFARIEEEYLLEGKDGPVHLSLELSREDYEAMIEPYLAETLAAVQIAMRGPPLRVADLDEVLLVGGATRTPLIERRLERELGRQPRVELDPDLCVATGRPSRGRSPPGAGLPGPGRYHPLYLRYQRHCRSQWGNVPLHLYSLDPQEQPDPGHQERGLLHRP